MEGFYNNSGYNNNRNRKKTLIIDFDDNDNVHLGNGSEFKIDLFEPLIIDKHSEIYLDHFMTFNCNLGDTYHQGAFVLKINEFNINSGVASNSSGNIISGGIIIPNDNNNINNYFGKVSHKSKKFNYICDINPCKLTSITGKITDMNNQPIFHGTNTATTKLYTYALVGISAWPAPAPGSGTKRTLVKGETVQSITPDTGTAADADVRILVTTVVNSSIIYFTSSVSLTPSDWDAQDINFVIDAGSGYTEYDFELTTALNPGMHLLKSDGARFIAEFSIVSRE